jgi:predicted ATPase/class 3 adenylate cyclase
MDHHLVPEIILSNAAQGCFAGHFHAVCLFVDLSGFTPLTTTLMEHGVEGAEVIAEVLSAVFDPLIEIIYTRGGFVAAFAGDAFTAIFPIQDANAYLRATLAAWQINQTVVDNPTQITHFGRFNFAIKVSLADGMVDWGIWQPAAPPDGTQAAPDSGQKAVYFFVGEALARCHEADHFNTAGAVIMTEAVYAQLPKAGIAVERRAHYRRLTFVAATLSQSLTNVASAKRAPNHDLATTFFPRDLLQRETIGEFRQVATLFVNLQKLPTGPEAEQFQATLFHLLAQYGGYLSFVGYSGHQGQGCTLVLFWGAPISYENNLRRALHFMFELRKAAAIPLRASVVFNLAYAGFVGSARHKAYTCYGACVILAARQMMIAHWGEIWLDEATARQVQAEFTLREQGWYTLKGLAKKQRIFVLEHYREAAAPTFRRNLMVGRQREWEQLWQAVQPIFQGKFGGAITIVGEVGMGKRRLVYEFQNQMEIYSDLYRQDRLDAGPHAAVAVVWCACRTDEINHQPLHPFCDWLRHYFHQSPAADTTLNKQCFDERLDELIAATSDQALADELERTRALLAALVGLQWADSLYQQLEPAFRFDNTLDALKTLIKAESLRQPLILYVEAAHWLDAQSKLFLEKLTHNVEDFPFLLLITTRPPTPIEHDQATARAGWLRPAVRQTTLHLAPLTKADLQLLATYQLQGAVTAPLVDLLNKRAAGNPFFAEQILLYWQEHALLFWSDQGWQLQMTDRALSSGDLSPLSASGRTILIAHLDRLPQGVKEVVQTAAILGVEFDGQVLAQMLSHNAALPTQMVIAEQANIWSAISEELRPISGATEPARYRFRHALLRDGAYDMQLRTQLRRLHQCAAAAIQQVYATHLASHYAELVYHYHQSEDRRQERHYAQLAGEDAAGRYANEDAVHYLSRAFALTDEQDLTNRFTLLIQREALYNLLGQRQEQVQDLHLLHMLAASIQNERARLEVGLKQAYYQRVVGHYEAALTLVQQVVAQATQLNDHVAEARAYHTWGRILLQQGYLQAALPRLARALAITKASNSRLDEADNLYDIGHVYHACGQPGLAAAYYTQARALYQALGNQRGDINCLLMFGVIANEQGDYMMAHNHYAQTLMRCRAIGWRYAEAASLTNLGNNYFDFGDYEAALSCHQQALALCRELGDQEGEAVSLDTLGLIWQNLGNLASAHTHFKQALQIQRQIGDLRSQGFTLTHLGYTLCALGDLKVATDALQSAYDLRHELGEESHTMDDLAGLAQIALTQRKIKRAMVAVEKILAWLQANGIDGIEFPILVYLICHQVLTAAAQIDPVLSNRVVVTLQDGYTLLQQRAAKIQDTGCRRKFLKNVWFNRKIIAEWEQQNAHAQQTNGGYNRLRFFVNPPEKL